MYFETTPYVHALLAKRFYSGDAVFSSKRKVMHTPVRRCTELICIFVTKHSKREKEEERRLKLLMENILSF